MTKILTHELRHFLITQFDQNKEFAHHFTGWFASTLDDDFLEADLGNLIWDFINVFHFTCSIYFLGLDYVWMPNASVSWTEAASI